jgi:hypothetical protein
MKTILIILVAIPAIFCQEKLITSWKKSTGTGYNGYTADVTSVSYGANNVFVSANSIPSYTIGPKWKANPNTPKAQGSSWKFSRAPAQNTGTKTATKLGAIGLWIDGVEIYNGYDGNRYRFKLT